MFFLFVSQPQRSEKEAHSSPNTYEQFLAAQKKRASEWKSDRDSKRVKSAPAVNHPPEASSVHCDRRQEDTIKLLRQQLDTKTAECHDLKRTLKNIEEQNALILKNQTEMQENFFKVNSASIVVSLSVLVDWLALCNNRACSEFQLNLLAHLQSEQFCSILIEFLVVGAIIG